MPSITTYPECEKSMPRGATKFTIGISGTASIPMVKCFCTMVSTTTRLTRDGKGSETQERRLKN